MPPQPKLNTKLLQVIRETEIAVAIKQLQHEADQWPEHGQHLAFAINHLRMAFMELGYASALTKGLDPLANKVEGK